MSEITSPEDIERLAWRLSGWRVEQRALDALLGAVQEYAQGCVDSGRVAVWSPVGPPPPEEPSQGAVGGPGQVPAGEETPEGAGGLQTGAQGVDLEGAYVLTVTKVAKPAFTPVRTASRQDPSETTRTCRKCGQTYRLEKFSRDKTSKGGRKTACTPCENIRRRDERRKRRAAEREAREARIQGREAA
jgi:hypothetical protein